MRVKSWFSRFGTLRWRLTIFYTALLSILLVGLGGFVYVRLESYLTENLQNRLLDYASTQTFIPDNRRGGPIDRGNNRNNTLALSTLSEVLAGKPVGDIHPVVLDSQGQVVQPGNITLTLNPVSPLPDTVRLNQANKQGIFYTTNLTGTNEPAQVYLMPVTDKNLTGNNSQTGATLGYLMLTAPLQANLDLLGETRFLLISGLAGVVLLAILAGNPLARFGLRPMIKITEIARRTRSSDLSQRVPMPPGISAKLENRDEVWLLAAEFNAMLDKIEAAFKAQQLSEARMRQFVADASHELRSPLTVVGGYLEVLAMGAKNDPAQAEHIRTAMQMEINRLSRLVVDLLLLTRLDSNGNAALKTVPLELDELLERTVQNMRMLAGERRLILALEPEASGAWVKADPDQLYRVLVNLIDNAIRYTGPNGQIKLGLGLEKPGNGQQWVNITVKDDGCGIAPEQLPNIFNRFYRADQSRARETGNAGLGLAISKGIIEAHGGQIRVESTVGQGTTFIIRLPLLGLESDVESEQLDYSAS